VLYILMLIWSMGSPMLVSSVAVSDAAFEENVVIAPKVTLDVVKGTRMLSAGLGRCNRFLVRGGGELLVMPNVRVTLALVERRNGW
jgi:hypothetical protein